MKSTPRWAALLAIPVLAGGLSAALGGRGTEATLEPQVPRARSAPAAGDRSASSLPTAPVCAPGPARLSEFEFDPRGFPKAAPRRGTQRNQFYFARAIYSNRGRGGDYLGDGGPPWSIDYPNADRVMMRVARRLSSLDACEWEFPISLADPDLRKFPFLYSLEWGYADLTDREILGLRNYLLSGGLLMLDDFWGSMEWANFEWLMGQVLPEHPIEEIPREHILFRSYYNIDGEILQIPNVGNGRAVGMGFPGASTSERDGYQAHIRGIFDDKGRLMVVINWNTDLGDALEWAEDPNYPLQFSRFASELFMNTIVYAMTQ
jgi:hypothetical protein